MRCSGPLRSYRSRRQPTASIAFWRARVEQAGQPMGGKDLLIAAQVIALGCVLVTDNERELARIDEIPRENWLRPG